MNRQSGYSLIEVMVVIGIIGILSAIALPNYISWLPKYRVGVAIRRLHTEMNLARAKAVSDNNNYVVSFDANDHSYTILDDDDDDGAADAGEHKKTVEIQKDAPNIVIAGVSFSGTPPRVTFAPTGLSNKNGSVYLQPNGLASLQKHVTVLMTGRVKIFYQ